MCVGLKYHMDTKSFILSCQDAQDMDDWRLRIKGATASKFTGKMAIKTV